MIIRNRLFYFFNLLADGKRRWVMYIHLLTNLPVELYVMTMTVIFVFLNLMIHNHMREEI